MSGLRLAGKQEVRSDDDRKGGSVAFKLILYRKSLTFAIRHMKTSNPVEHSQLYVCIYAHILYCVVKTRLKVDYLP